MRLFPTRSRSHNPTHPAASALAGAVGPAALEVAPRHVHVGDWL